MDTDRRLGLVLGGGAARGWAHIGVIRALEQAGVVPDIVAGSSVGAVVGGAWAAGRLDAFEHWISGLDRLDILRLLDARIRGGGLLMGKVLMQAIEKQVGNPDIGQLRRPFGCVATELHSGRELWFREGPLMDACRASISLPGLFSPARYNGDYLLDGGLVNPVPVSLARAMGADVVIGVNLNGELIGHHFWADHPAPVGKVREVAPDKQGLRKRWLERFGAWLPERVESYLSPGDDGGERPPGLIDVIMGSIDIMQDRITRSRMVGEPPDLHLAPTVNRIGLMEFERAAECIEEGRRAVERKRDELDLLLQLLAPGDSGSGRPR